MQPITDYLHRTTKAVNTAFTLIFEILLLNEALPRATPRMRVFEAFGCMEPSRSRTKSLSGKNQ